MYTAHFGLRCLPFEDRAEAQFFHAVARHEEALAAMEYVAHYGAGIGLVLGDPGTGKTLLIRALLARLHATDHVVVITAQANGTSEIVRECCKGFGVSLPSPSSGDRLIQRLQRHLARTQAAGHQSILIVDQAEHLNETQLGEIETLSDLQTGHGRLLRVILAGHPRLRAMLDRPEFAKIRQQAFGEQVLSALSEPETRDYIRHRLEIAGAGRVDLFESDAIAPIHAAASGTPRRINQICNAAMLAAYGANESRVTASIVAELEDRASAGQRGPEIKRALDKSMDNQFRDTPATPDLAVRAESPIGAGRIAVQDGAAIEPVEIRAIGRSATTGDVASNAIAAELRLSALIERAEQLEDQFSRGIPQSSDSAARIQRRIDRILADADDRARMLESRLAEVGSSGDEWLRKSQHVERACRRAEDVEARMSAFAGQLADRVDEVQRQVSQMVAHVAPADDVRAQLEALIARAGSACDQVRRAVDELATMSRQGREAADRATRDVAESSANVERIARETIEKEARNIVQVQMSAMRSFAEDVQREIETKTAKVVADGEVSLKAVRAEMDRLMRESAEARQLMADETMDRFRDGMSAQVDSFEQRAEGIIRTSQSELVKVAREQAAVTDERMGLLSAEVAHADDATDRLNTLQIDANMLAAKLDADATTAKQTGHALAGLIAQTEQKLNQLVSMQAAATHLHERLARATVDGHRIVERMAEAEPALDKKVVEAQVKVEAMTTEVASAIGQCAAQIERSENERAALANDLERIRCLSGDGSRVAMELALLVEQGGRTEKAIEKRVAEGETVVKQLDTLNSTVAAAAESDTLLKQTTASGESLRSQLLATLDQSRRQQEVLAEACATIDEFVTKTDRSGSDAKDMLDRADARIAQVNEAREQLEVLVEQYQQVDSSARAAVDRMDSYLASLKGAVQGGEGLLSEYLSRVGVVDEQIGHLLERSSAVERKVADASGRFKSIVEEAIEKAGTVTAESHSQSEHLERVCAAVKKVFAGLSQAGLQANEQTESLRRAGVEAKRQHLQLVSETDRVTKTLHEWLQEAMRVQTRLEQVLQQAPSVALTHPAAPLQSAIRRLGQIERTATVRVEDEPGAAKALDVRMGGEQIGGRGADSRAEEIARLITEARNSSARPVGAV